MGLKSLAEGIILQAIDDLFSRRNRAESIRFLTGEGFRMSADIAGLGPEQRHEILTSFGKLLKPATIHARPPRLSHPRHAAGGE